MKRQGAEGEFRSNLHRGGSASLTKITPQERRTAVAAAKIMGLNVAGVDLLRSSRGPLVMEVNSSPGLEGIETATGKDIAGMIIEFIQKTQQVKGHKLVAKAKKNHVFEFLGQSILPGERKVIELEAAKLYTHSPLSFPVEIIHGRLAGPVLMVNAAIHGDELNGVEIVRQLIDTIEIDKLKGTLIAVPIVNVFGFIHKSRYLPDRRDLNRCFPGSEKGSLASRMAHTFFSQVAKRCDYILDLHTGSIHRTNLPQIRANLTNAETLRIAQAFATPVIIDAPLRPGSLRSEAEQLNIPVLTYEAGEALRFEPICINAGFGG